MSLVKSLGKSIRSTEILHLALQLQFYVLGFSSDFKLKYEEINKQVIKNPDVLSEHSEHSEM